MRQGGAGGSTHACSLVHQAQDRCAQEHAAVVQSGLLLKLLQYRVIKQLPGGFHQVFCGREKTAQRQRNAAAHIRFTLTDVSAVISEGSESR